LASLKEYLVEERTSLQQLSANFASDYQEQVMKSFMESPLLPGGSFNLLLLSEGTSKKELLQNLALTAYDRFVSSYLEQVAAYTAQTVEEFAREEMQVLSWKFTGPEQLDRLLNIFAKARSDDPVLEWFINEGAALLSDMRVRLLINEVDGLAALIRQLEYYSLIFTSTTGDVESYSFIIDIPERATSELAELGLLAAARQVDSLRGVILEPESFKYTWEQDAFPLVDWQRSILKIDTKEVDSIAWFVEEWKKENAGQAGQFKTALSNLLTPTFELVLEISVENIKFGIKTGEKGRGISDEQADHPSSSAAA